MIPQTVTYTKNSGTSITLGSADYPLTEFDMPMYRKNSPVSKAQFPGQFPTFSYPDYKEFLFTGDVLGDDVTDFNNLERAMRNVFATPYGVLTARRHGTLTMTFFGDAASYFAYVIVGDLTIPKIANYPSVAEYHLQLLSFEPYLRNTVTGAISYDY